MKLSPEIEKLKIVLQHLKEEGKISLAYLYGSYASETQHARSDIDLAVYVNVGDEEAQVVIDSILMSVDKQVEVLRLDDEEESPYLIQEALKGVPLVEPDTETMYRVAHRALHEAETIRYKRKEAVGA